MQAQLERVLESKAFRGSSRSQEFLKYVVKRLLEGDEQSIKERNLAVEVFGRPVDYNSSEDSFVRVKASEVRRRLEAYYREVTADDILRIEMPLGTYVPQFSRLQSVVVPTSVPVEFAELDRKRSGQERRHRRLWAWMAGIGCLVALIALLQVRSFWRTPMEEFWSPVFNSSEPLLIFLPIPPSFTPVKDTDIQSERELPWQAVSPSGERALLAATPHKVGLGAAVGAVRFAALCARAGKADTLKAGEDFTFADLRNQPSILFGAFSSPWTVEFNNEYRFKFVRGPAIQDGHDGKLWKPLPGPHTGTPNEDYALATRVFEPKSGRIVIIAAGISTFGTQAAAEFLTGASRLAELARKAPQPLHKGNFQVLLHTRVIGNTPTPARIVDTYFW